MQKLRYKVHNKIDSIWPFRLLKRTYRVDSRSFLARARKMLDRNTNQSLIYAALELRLGIESRMLEYLEAQDHISAKKKKGWRIQKLGKNIESAFKSGDSIIEVVLTETATKKNLATLYFTPVSNDLKKHAEQLGGLLHFDGIAGNDQKWWDENREFLDKTYDGLNKATTGCLLGPPMIHRSANTIDMNMELTPSTKRLRNHFRQVGANVTMIVNYLDDIPK